MPGLLEYMAQLSSPLLMNPNLQRQGVNIREQRFQSGIKALPWYQEFIRDYGEPPDLSANSDYDYRRAWSLGIRPQRNQYDAGRYHWPSSDSTGAMLKSQNHPTLWKEHFMRAFGVDPDEVGYTKERWEALNSMAPFLEGR